MKEHEYFCCTKIINSNDIIQNLRIKLDKKVIIFKNILNIIFICYNNLGDSFGKSN